VTPTILSSLKMCLCAGAVGALVVPAIHHAVSHIRHHHTRPTRALAVTPVPCAPTPAALANLAIPLYGAAPANQQLASSFLPAVDEVGQIGGLPYAYSPSGSRGSLPGVSGRSPAGGVSSPEINGGSLTSGHGSEGGIPGRISTPVSVPALTRMLVPAPPPISMPIPAPLHAVPTPEPATVALFGLGLATVMLRGRNPRTPQRP